jgi:hypothetical protein
VIHHIRSATLAALLAALASMALFAQPRWGRGALPRAGVCFYQDANFEGNYFCVQRGEDLASMPPGMNDRISSLRTFGNVNVVVFKDVRFRGASARFDNDVRNLRSQGWNDLISSVRVNRGGWGGGSRPSWGNPSIPREGACFYSDKEYGGMYFCVPRGGSYATLPEGFNDRISSIRVMRARVMIFRDVDFSGRSERIDGDIPNLGGRWNDALSSLRVY